MAEIGHQLLMVLQKSYNDRFAQIYHPIPYTPLPDDCTRHFIMASQALDAVESLPDVLGGCLFFETTVLCTHFDDTLTRLIFLKVCGLYDALLVQQRSLRQQQQQLQVSVAVSAAHSGLFGGGAAVPELFLVYLLPSEQEALLCASAERHFYSSPFFDPLLANEQQASLAAAVGVAAACTPPASRTEEEEGEWTATSSSGSGSSASTSSSSSSSDDSNAEDVFASPSGAGPLSDGGATSGADEATPLSFSAHGRRRTAASRVGAGKDGTSERGGAHENGTAPDELLPHGLVVYIVGTVALALVLAEGLEACLSCLSTAGRTVS